MAWLSNNYVIKATLTRPGLFSRESPAAEPRWRSNGKIAISVMRSYHAAAAHRSG